MPEQPALGLERGKTIVQAYDSRWHHAGQTELANLRLALGDTVAGLEHVGSTAVPGLAAKPVLDIAAGYSEPGKIPEIRTRLESLGFMFHRDQGDAGGLVFIKGPESSRTHYLHLVLIDSEQWLNYLRFRDALRADSTLRAAYEALKVDLAARFQEDRRAYLDAKTTFVESVLGPRTRPSSR